MKVLLALEDGTTFYGRSFTGACETTGEVVFNTSMSGYQEILTDPSYCGQIVTMTYPLIGNYGINHDDIESGRIQVKALVVKEYQEMPSNWRSKSTLKDYLNAANIPGIEGIDTRALTRHIREKGAMRGAISTSITDPAELAEVARNAPDMKGMDLVKYVTCKTPMIWLKGKPVEITGGLDKFVWPINNGKWRVVAIDYGVKYNILRSLEKNNCNILIVPAGTDSETINKLRPDGIFLSNGPGDPAAVTYAVQTIKEQIGKKPIFGICLGHQLIGLSLGGKTFKLKFGHRGGNQPVQDLITGKVDITSQNHGFCVDMDSLTDPDIEISHVNLNDNTVEGLFHKKYPLFSVQYHPEASPGPHDAEYLFKKFVELIKQDKEK